MNRYLFFIILALVLPLSTFAINPAGTVEEPRNGIGAKFRWDQKPSEIVGVYVETLWIESIYCDSPAFKAGLQKGDTVLLLNSYVIFGMPISQLNVLLDEIKESDPGTSIGILFKRKINGAWNYININIPIAQIEYDAECE